MTSPTIRVNGVPIAWEQELTVSELVSRYAPSARGIAVALDRMVVPRSEWDTTTVVPDAEVEIVTAVAGG